MNDSLPYPYRGHRGQVGSAAWSPDGRRIASSSEDETVQIWDAAGGKHLLTYREQTPVDVVTWSPDGTRLASSGEDGTVQVWQPPRS